LCGDKTNDEKKRKEMGGHKEWWSVVFCPRNIGFFRHGLRARLKRFFNGIEIMQSAMRAGNSRKTVKRRDYPRQPE